MNQIKSLSFIFGATIALLFTSCEPTVKTELFPVLTTVKVSAITPTTAISGGDISHDGGSAVYKRGVCWSTKTNPTITDSKTDDGTGSGVYDSYITGLTLGTTYYVRAYAINSEGTAYGANLQFVTADIVYGTMTDQDGITYPTVTIGKQTWMTENLKATKYRNGDAIANVTDNTAWAALTTGAWCNYNNNIALGNKYGKLYNFYAVTDARNLAPAGWHVATDAEWTTLTDYVSTHLGSSLTTGKALAATSDWAGDNNAGGGVGNNLNINNSTGFNALPCGTRNGSSGYFLDATGEKTYWWTATQNGSKYAWYRGLNYNGNNLVRSDWDNKDGFSIRCVKD